MWGTLRVTTAGAVVGPRGFPGVKPKQLLEILAVERGHAVSKSRLADLLWGEDLPRNYPATLETYVSVMRQTIEPGVRARDSVVMTEHGGYRLDSDRTTFDLEQFDALVRASADSPPVQALAALTEALTIVRGPVLEDELYAAWADPLRFTYGQKQVQVLIDAGRLSLITGEAGAALALAEQAVALDPLAEAAYQIVMTASYALWRQEEALRAFDRCRILLADELGVGPMDETVALHLAILRHEDVAALMPRPASEPAQVAKAFPAPRPGLLGRTDELELMQGALDGALEGQFTIVLVVGDSGIGKTRLTEAVLERVAVPVGSNRCSDLEAQLPYLALSLALRSVLSDGTDNAMPVVNELLRRAELSLPLDQFARMGLMESLASDVERSSPFVLVLDDAHWADAETLATLGYLRRRCPGAPVAVLLTADRRASQEGGLRHLHVDLRIDLSELSAADLGPLGATAFEGTQGHPMLLADWVTARDHGLPEGITPALRERIITRCWDLGPQSYRLLTVAALLEEPFSPDMLSRLVGASRDIVDELDLRVDDRLLVSVGDGFQFRHRVVRRILAETFSAARRTRLLAGAHELADGPRQRRSTDGAQRREEPQVVLGAEPKPSRAISPAAFAPAPGLGQNRSVHWDGGEGWSPYGLGPYGVVGAIDVPLDVLACDDTLR